MLLARLSSAKDNGDKLFLVQIIFVLILIIITLIVGLFALNSRWKTVTVKQGYAEYNISTGSWQWIGEKNEKYE